MFVHLCMYAIITNPLILEYSTSRVRQKLSFFSSTPRETYIFVFFGENELSRDILFTFCFAAETGCERREILDFMNKKQNSAAIDVQHFLLDAAVITNIFVSLSFPIRFFSQNKNSAATVNYRRTGM